MFISTQMMLMGLTKFVYVTDTEHIYYDKYVYLIIGIIQYQLDLTMLSWHVIRGNVLLEYISWNSL